MWRLTLPIVPLLIVFGANLLVLWQFILPNITVPDYQAALLVERDVRPGVTNTRLSVLYVESFWCVVRLAGILCAVLLAGMVRWPWQAASVAKPRDTWLVIAIAMTVVIFGDLGAEWGAMLATGQNLDHWTMNSERDPMLYANLSAGVFFYSGLIMAPISEELVFRGWLQNVLTKRCGIWPALLLHAIPFGLIHYDQGIVGIIGTGLTGVLLGLVYLLTGKLWPSMLCHALVNLYVYSGDLHWIMMGRQGDPLV